MGAIDKCQFIFGANFLNIEILEFEYFVNQIGFEVTFSGHSHKHAKQETLLK